MGGSAFLSSFTTPEVNPSERKRWEDWETHSGAGIEQSGRFTGNKPNTPSSDWLHVQSTPANNYLLLFVHEMISNNQKELYCQLVNTYESTIILPQKCCWATAAVLNSSPRASPLCTFRMLLLSLQTFVLFERKCPAKWTSHDIPPWFQFEANVFHS